MDTSPGLTADSMAEKLEVLETEIRKLHTYNRIKKDEEEYKARADKYRMSMLGIENMRDDFLAYVLFTAIVDKNMGARTLTAVSQQLLSIRFALLSEQTVMVDIYAQLECSESQLITCVVEIGGVPVRTFEEYFIVDPGEADSKKHIFDISFPLEGMASTTGQIIAVKMRTSVGTADIEIRGAYLVIAAREFATPGVDLNPEVYFDLTAIIASIAPVDMAVSIVAAKMIDPALLTVIIAPPPSIPDIIVIYERFQTGDDAQLGVYDTTWEGQSFETTATGGHTCDYVGIKAYRVGDPGTVDVKIYGVDGAGLPTGAALVSGSFTGSDLPEVAEGAKWKNIILSSPGALSPSTKYALVLSAPAAVDEGEAWQNMGALTNISLAANRTIGWAFQLSAARNVTHLSIYPRNSDTFKLHLWDGVTNSLLADVTGACTANQWNHLALAAPESLDAAHTYVVSFNYPTGTGYHYRNNPAALELHPEVIYAQGRYATAHDTYPGTADSAYANGVLGFLTDAPGRVMWRNDSTAPPYAGGSRVYSPDGGTNWSADVSRDFMFEEGDAQ